MKKLFLVFGFVGLLSCGPKGQEQPVTPGISAGAVGSYGVTAYIVGGDTLFAVPPILGSPKGGINKVGVDSFFMIVRAGGPDQLSVTTTFWQKGLRSTFAKEVTVRALDNYSLGFFPAKTYAPISYETSLRGSTGVLIERTVGGHIVIPALEGAIAPGQSNNKEVIIVAKRLSTEPFSF